MIIMRSTSAAQNNFLGGGLKRTLDKTLPLMIEALKKDPAAWYRDQHLKPPHHFPNVL